MHENIEFDISSGKNMLKFILLSSKTMVFSKNINFQFKRRDPGLSILKARVRAMNWGDGLDIYPQLEGDFGSMRTILPITLRPRSKKQKEWGRASAFNTIRFVSTS